MNTSLKRVSDVDVASVIEYLRETEGNVDVSTIETYIIIAKDYISRETGIDSEDLDDYPTFVHALLMLCQEMHDNRALTIDKGEVNPIVTSILNHPRRNLIC